MHSDTQSQKDVGFLKKQSQNMTVDSGQPTNSGDGGTKASKHDMSGSATDFVQNKSSLSQSDLGLASKKPACTIPKSYLHLRGDSNNSRHLNIR